MGATHSEAHVFTQPVDEAGIHVHPTDHSHVVMGMRVFFLFGLSGC